MISPPVHGVKHPVVDGKEIGNDRIDLIAK